MEQSNKKLHLKDIFGRIISLIFAFFWMFLFIAPTPLTKDNIPIMVGKVLIFFICFSLVVYLPLAFIGKAIAKNFGWEKWLDLVKLNVNGTLTTKIALQVIGFLITLIFATIILFNIAFSIAKWLVGILF